MIRDVDNVWPMLWRALSRHPLLVLRASRCILRRHDHYGISLGNCREWYALFTVFADAFGATAKAFDATGESASSFVATPDDLRRAATWIKTEWVPLQGAP